MGVMVIKPDGHIPTDTVNDKQNHRHGHELVYLINKNNSKSESDYNESFPSIHRDIPIHSCAGANQEPRGRNRMEKKKINGNDKRKCMDGSLTVEAALVFPVLFFACMSLLYIMQAYYLFGMVQRDLNGEAKRQSRNALTEDYSGNIQEEEDEVEDGEEIIIQKSYDINLPAAVFAFKALHMEQVSITYPFTGKTIVPQSGDGKEGTEEYVYITPYGEVYHKSSDCVYLQPSVRKTAWKDVADLRNSSGAIYHECERCGGSGLRQTDTVYITTYGNRYHTKETCPGLKRTISKIPIEEAAGRRACGKCG